MDWSRFANTCFDKINEALDVPLPKIEVVIATRKMTRTAGEIRWYWRPAKHFTPIATVKGKRVHVQIRLSPVFIERDGIGVFSSTLGHEMAHLMQLVGDYPVNHDGRFQKFCLKLGVNPAQYHNYGREDEDGAFAYQCPVCETIKRYKGMVHESKGGICTACSVDQQVPIYKTYLGFPIRSAAQKGV